MDFLNLTLSTPEENLACDEALLAARETEDGNELLRVWEAPRPFVVLGCAGKIEAEVNQEACRRAGIPILRRTSGGGTVLLGQGCLNFSLLLRIPKTGPLSGITGTNQFLTSQHEAALRPLLGPLLQARGLSDLALDDLKISGNAQHRKKKWLLFHGTFLRDFDLPLIERVLKIPGRQPKYRQNRSHLEFLTNTGLDGSLLGKLLQAHWQAQGAPDDPPWAAITALAKERYARPDWTHRF